MDSDTQSKILKRSDYVLQKPRKTKDDQVIMIATIILYGATQGKAWLDETLKKFGWDEPITEDEKQLVLSRAAGIVSKN